MSTTAKGFRVMDDTDPLAQVASKMRDLGNDIDGALPSAKMTRGVTTVTTSAAAGFNINHGLGGTPTTVIFQIENSQNWTVTGVTKSSTLISGVVRSANANTGVASTSVTLSWMAML